MIKFVDVFILVFELIVNVTFTTIIFNKIIKVFKINFIINNNIVFEFSVFTSKTKFMINRVLLTHEIIATREIIIYNNEQTRAKMKTIID